MKSDPDPKLFPGYKTGSGINLFGFATLASIPFTKGIYWYCGMHWKEQWNGLSGGREKKWDIFKSNFAELETHGVELLHYGTNLDFLQT